MYADRETDILYLAHRLWEESDDPQTSPRTCWTKAAREILARSPRVPTPKAPAARMAAHCFGGGNGSMRITLRADTGISPVVMQGAPVAANAPRIIARMAK